MELGLYVLVRVEPSTEDAVELPSIFLVTEDIFEALYFKCDV